MPLTSSSNLKRRTLDLLLLVASLVAILAATLALGSPFRPALPKLYSRLNIPVWNGSRRSMATTAATATVLSNGAESAKMDASALNITKRPWNARGFADHSWLYTFHTFSFASYYSSQHESFGPLRVINEDRVQRGTGFGTHSHAEFLIWSYIVEGELEHRDSMGNLEILTKDDVQFTSAGTGIRHSEYNRNKEQDNHFLQIWAKPNVRGLKPSYCTRKFPAEMKKDKLVRIMESVDRHSGKEGPTEPIELHADLSMSASILSPGSTVEHDLVKEGGRNVYVHVVMRGKQQPASGGARIRIGDVELAEGDGAYVKGAVGPGAIQVESVGDKPAEFLLFDMET